MIRWLTLTLCALLPGAAAAAEERCMDALVSCQQQTGNPLQCRSEYIVCREAPLRAPVDASASGVLRFRVGLGTGADVEGGALLFVELRATNTGAEAVDLARTRGEYVAAVRCANGTVEEVRFLLGGRLEPGAERLVGRQLHCRTQGGAVAVLQGADQVGESPSSAACTALVDYRDTVLVALLEDNWPRQSMALGVSQATIDRLDAALAAIAQDADDLDFWSRAYDISVAASAILTSLKRIPVVGQAIDSGECVAKLLDERVVENDTPVRAASCVVDAGDCFKMLRNRDADAYDIGVGATGCVIQLSGSGKLKQAAEALYQMFEGTYAISRDLVELRDQQRQASNRVIMARNLLSARRSAITAALNDYRQALAERQAVVAINASRAAIDRLCAAPSPTPLAQAFEGR